MEGKFIVQKMNIAKFITYCEAVMQASDPVTQAKGYFIAKNSIIKRIWSNIDSTNDYINANVTAEDKVTNGPDFNSLHQSIQKDYEEAFIMLDKVTVRICMTIEQLEKPETKVQPLQLPENLFIHPANSANIKLKAIEIQPFSGDYNKWISFKNMFDSLIHKNKELNQLQKMHYLKSSLTGEAERLISQFDVAEESYMPAYEALTDRFHNEIILIDTHIINILSQPNLISETGEGIKELMDVTVENMRALEHLKVDTSTWDPLLLLLLVQKLDFGTRHLWEQNLQPKVKPSLKQFLDFLNIRFHALFCQKKFKFSMESLSTQHLHRINDHNDVQISSQQSCPICGGTHSIFSCESFRRANQSTRAQMVNGVVQIMENLERRPNHLNF